jgi:hypothetical protein
LSASIFLLEVLLTRLFSVTLFHHFAFAAISLGMLGLASGAVRVAVGGERFRGARLPGEVLRAATWLAVAAVFCVLVFVRIGVFPVFSWDRLAKIAVVFTLCAVPFFFGGVATAALFANAGSRFPFLYACDLLAAGAAGLAAAPLLRELGGPAALVAAGALGLAGSALALGDAPRRARLVGWGLVAAALVLIAADRSSGVLRLRNPKGSGSPPVLYEGWNEISRVAVYDAPMWPWALGPGYRGPVEPGLRLDIDAAAATPIVSVDAGAANQHLLHDVTAVGLTVAPPGRALVIGAGGGRDVLAALLAGATQVDAVEINGLIVDEVMRRRFRSESGGLYDDPRVRPHVADGRSFVRGSREHYDLIELSLVDTWAATAAGAFALSENNLYTVEAVEEYLQHLSPGGVLSLTRWVGGETYRLVILLLEGARRAGLEDPPRHLAVVGYPDETGRRNVPVTALIRRAPFDEPAMDRLREAVGRDGFEVLHDPLRRVPGRVSEIARSADPLAEARRTEEYELEPPTDDRPFFFYRPVPFLAGLVEQPARLFTEGRYLVSLVTALATLLGLGAILLPLWLKGREALSADPSFALRAAPYYVAIGVGFMFVEVSAMQRFVLYLGHPTHALTAVVAGLLIGAGLGSAAMQAAGSRAPSPAFAGLVACLTLVAMEGARGWVTATTQAAPFPAKVVLTEVFIVPIGVVLGTLMPLGVRTLVDRAPRLVPWAWGVNGFASVVGSCLAALVAMSQGFGVAFRVGVACYVVAAMAALLVGRGGPEAGLEPAGRQEP